MSKAITLAEHLKKIAPLGGKTMTVKRRRALIANLKKARKARALKRQGLPRKPDKDRFTCKWCLRTLSRAAHQPQWAESNRSVCRECRRPEIRERQRRWRLRHPEKHLAKLDRFIARLRAYQHPHFSPEFLARVVASRNYWSQRARRV